MGKSFSNISEEEKDMSKVTIDRDLCVKCGTCELCCPETVFKQKEKKSVPDVIHEHLCFSCGHCVAICPQEAIAHRDFPQGSMNAVNHELLPSLEQILEMLRARRSIRAFKDKQVERELIEQIIDGARFAPSGHNHQSVEYIVVQDRDVLDKLLKMTSDYFAKIAKRFRNPLIGRLLPLMSPDKVKDVLELLDDFEISSDAAAKGKDIILHNSPVLLIFHASNRLSFSDVNATLALHNANMVIQALGLGCFYAGYPVAAGQASKKIRDVLSLPKDHQIYGALAIGYPRFEYKKWIERKPAKIHWK
jgi:nitroreductase/Pyruvate/2-oxoacid:ferredoxin oxidoreductase delta subunit